MKSSSRRQPSAKTTEVPTVAQSLLQIAIVLFLFFMAGKAAFTYLAAAVSSAEPSSECQAAVTHARHMTSDGGSYYEQQAASDLIDDNCN